MEVRYLTFMAAISSKLAALARLARYYGVTFKVYICVSSIVACAVIAHSLSLHLTWNPNGAFEHVVKEWKAITSLLWRQTAQNWLPGPDKLGTMVTFEVCICVSSIVAHAVIAHSMSLHLTWNPNGAFVSIRYSDWGATTKEDSLR